MSALSPDEQEIFDVGKASIPRFLFQKDNAPSEPFAAAAKAFALAKTQVKSWLTAAYIRTATGFWLDQHAVDRGTRRQAGESDATLSSRLRQIEDAVTVPALLAATQAVLAASGVVGTPTIVENHVVHGFRHSTGSASAFRSFFGRGERFAGGAYPGSGSRLVIIILPLGTPAGVAAGIRGAAARKKGGGYSVTTETPRFAVADRVSVTPQTALPAFGGAAVQFTAQQTAVGSITWKVDGIVGGNSTVGTISGTGLYTPPIVVTSNGIYNHDVTATVGTVVGTAKVQLH